MSENNAEFENRMDACVDDHTSWLCIPGPDECNKRRETTWEAEAALRNITNSAVISKWKWLFVSDRESNSMTSSDNIFKNVPNCDKCIFLLRDYDYNTSEE